MQLRSHWAKYLGRYLKKPPVSGARLAHYDGGSRITLRFLDHRTSRHEDLELSQHELILRLIKHIPEKHFRMVRYFGFLANRVVGRLLPLMRKALGQDEVRKVVPVTFATLSQGLLGTDPFACLLCGAKMAYSRALAAVPREKLIACATEITRMRYAGGYGEDLPKIHRNKQSVQKSTIGQTALTWKSRFPTLTAHDFRSLKKFEIPRRRD